MSKFSKTDFIKLSSGIFKMKKNGKTIFLDKDTGGWVYIKDKKSKDFFNSLLSGTRYKDIEKYNISSEQIENLYKSNIIEINNRKFNANKNKIFILRNITEYLKNLIL